jgi:hypothetical protein
MKNVSIVFIFSSLFCYYLSSAETSDYSSITFQDSLSQEQFQHLWSTAQWKKNSTQEQILCLKHALEQRYQKMAQLPYVSGDNGITKYTSQTITNSEEGSWYNNSITKSALITTGTIGATYASLHAEQAMQHIIKSRIFGIDDALMCYLGSSVFSSITTKIANYILPAIIFGYGGYKLRKLLFSHNYTLTEEQYSRQTEDARLLALIQRNNQALLAEIEQLKNHDQQFGAIIVNAQKNTQQASEKMHQVEKTVEETKKINLLLQNKIQRELLPLIARLQAQLQLQKQQSKREVKERKSLLEALFGNK